MKTAADAIFNCEVKVIVKGINGVMYGKNNGKVIIVVSANTLSIVYNHSVYVAVTLI